MRGEIRCGPNLGAGLDGAGYVELQRTRARRQPPGLRDSGVNLTGHRHRLTGDHHLGAPTRVKGRIVASLDNVFHAEYLADILSNRQGIGPGECHGVISPGLRHSISREHSTQVRRLIGKKVLQLLPLFVAGALVDSRSRGMLRSRRSAEYRTHLVDRCVVKAPTDVSLCRHEQCRKDRCTKLRLFVGERVRQAR